MRMCAGGVSVARSQDPIKVGRSLIDLAEGVDDMC